MKIDHEIKAFELSARELDLRAAGAFFDLYVMLVGLIQSAATAVWVAKALAATGLPAQPLPEFGGMCLRFTASFFVIIIVTYEYIYSVSVFRRYPRYRDIVATLMLGISEVLSMSYILNEMYWWAWSAAFSFAGMIAYLTTWSVHHHNLPKNSKAFNVSIHIIIRNIVITGLSTAVCVVGAYLAASYIPWFAYGAYLSLGGVMIICGRRALPQMRTALLEQDKEKEADRLRTTSALHDATGP